ncbi:S8 family peptidase [Metabacillus fastidiosus]|uniref:S8 family peptidase n=1 Tax=Metabacillus fastidiosus TaxID=1458 RepID=UPI003AF08916
MLNLATMELVKRVGHKLDTEMRRHLVEWNPTFRFIPYFMHRPLEKMRRKIKKLPLIIEFEQDGFKEGINDVKNTKCRNLLEHPSISCCSAKLSIEKIEHLLDNCQHIKKVFYDRKVATLLDKAVPAINSNVLQQSGLTGKGVTIAVIDTGIYPHPDLQGRIKAFKDFVNNRTSPYDDNGHGTHCAGDAAGNGALSSRKYRGPASDAQLVGVKVLDRMGSGYLSNVIAGIDWCIQNKSQFNINIMSLSLGSPAVQSAQDDPVVRAAEKAWDQGIVVCAAAGNEGPALGTIASPGISPKIITVGALDDYNTTTPSNFTVAPFSSRGPTIDGLVKPDLLTPGVSIISLRSPSSYLDQTNPGARVGSYYFALSGTSMATPICAGVVAQLLQREPALSPNEVKTRLIRACTHMGQPPNLQGNGYLDAAKLLQ